MQRLEEKETWWGKSKDSFKKLIGDER